MLFKKYLCACGAELAPKPEGKRSFAFELSFEDTPAFKAEIEAPLLQCTACGKEQVRSRKELHRATTSMMVEICDRAGFPHSG